MNRRRSGAGRVRQISEMNGRRPSTTLRQSPPRACVCSARVRSQRSRCAASVPNGTSSAMMGLGTTSRCTCGSSPRRESAMMGPVCPLSNNDRTVSTMVKPVPRMSTRPSLGICSRADASHGFWAVPAWQAARLASLPVASTATWPESRVPSSNTASTPSVVSVMAVHSCLTMRSRLVRPSHGRNGSSSEPM